MDSNMKLQQSRHSWQKWIFKIRLVVSSQILNTIIWLLLLIVLFVKMLQQFFFSVLVDDDDGVFYLKQNCYYMHVQYQLNVCKKGKCFFVDFTFMVAFYQNYSCFTRNIIDNFLLKIYNLIYVICFKPKTCVERQISLVNCIV